jgi:hypothetical protein
MSGEVLRYAAFPTGDAGGNPAGVVLDARGMTDEEMLAVAAEVGFSETAFLFPPSPRRTASTAPAMPTCATSASSPRCRSAACCMCVLPAPLCCQRGSRAFVGSFSFGQAVSRVAS